MGPVAARLGLQSKRRGRPLPVSGRQPGSSLYSVDVSYDDDASPSLVIATIFPEHGRTGVHTHVRQLCDYLEKCGVATTFVTPFSWCRPLAYPIFAPRLVLKWCSAPASVIWYRYWHEVFLRNALRRRLAEMGDCVIYAQGPMEARAALRARRGPYQRVSMAVHFRVSQADEYAEPGRELKRDGIVFRAIRRDEREVIPRVDSIVYVSQWARNSLLSWLPEADQVPYAVIGNFVAPAHPEPDQELLGDLVTTGRLDANKNHRFLLEVLAVAKRGGRSLTLDVFGEGPLRRNLLRLTRSLGLQEQVRFHGFRRDVREFLPRYRAYVHAAYAEVAPLAIIEAMAAGLPIVAGNLKPIFDLCDDGVEGRFWPLDDPSKAAAILIDLLDSESSRLSIANAARKRFHRDFNADIIAPRLRSFLLGFKYQDPRSLPADEDPDSDSPKGAAH